MEKKKRTDVSNRLKNRKNIQERVVCCSLLKRLGNELNDNCRSILRQEIDSWVINVSKITHRLGFMFNRLLLYIINNNLKLPIFNDAFFNGLALYGLKKSSKQSKLDFSSLINDFCYNEFNAEHQQFPIITRNKGDCQAIKIASSKYKTNFLTSLCYPFYLRQKKFISTWCFINNINIEERKYIQYEINGWKYKNKIEFESKIKEFIIEQRNLLGNPKDVRDEWLKNNPSVVLLYYHNILKYYSLKERGNKFRLAPLCKIKCHFLTIDNTILKEILNNVINKSKDIGFPDWLIQKVKNKDMCLQVWKAIFNYDGLRKQMTFSNRVETDGTKINFHFQITVKKKNKKIKRRKLKYDKNTRIISIDPGRVNIITAYDKEKERYYTLTRKYYYRACGMRSLVKKNNERNLTIKGVLESMSSRPSKSINDMDWYLNQQILKRHYDKLWALNTTEEKRRENFKVKRLKEKCLDRFLNQFQEKGESRPTLIYGAATINPTGKGELTVPIKYIYEKCKQRYNTIKVDEKNTTLMHFKCQNQTLEVRTTQNSIRGLRWCPTCRELVSRDRNACKNIRLLNVSPRPNYLSETIKREKKYFLLKVKIDTTPITKMSVDI